MWNFYVCASVGILIKYFDDMHGATIRVSNNVYIIYFEKNTRRALCIGTQYNTLSHAECT